MGVLAGGHSSGAISFPVPSKFANVLTVRSFSLPGLFMVNDSRKISQVLQGDTTPNKNRFRVSVWVQASG